MLHHGFPFRSFCCRRTRPIPPRCDHKRFDGCTRHPPPPALPRTCSAAETPYLRPPALSPCRGQRPEISCPRLSSLEGCKHLMGEPGRATCTQAPSKKNNGLGCTRWHSTTLGATRRTREPLVVERLTSLCFFVCFLQSKGAQRPSSLPKWCHMSGRRGGRPSPRQE